MLPSLIPTARILGFGLNLKNITNPINFQSTALSIMADLTEKRQNCPSRAVIFVGHGYGNVVIEKLLCGTPESTVNTKSLVGSTAAIVLFAAPFEDADNLINWTCQALKVPRDSKMFTTTSSNDLVSPQILETLHKCAREHGRRLFAFLERPAAPDRPDTVDITDSQARNTKLDHLKQRVDLLKEMVDRLWETDAAIEEVGKFSGPDDPHFQALGRCISDAIRTHQLLVAAAMGNEESIRQLIGESVDLNLSGRDGRTVLHAATEAKFLGIVRQLLWTNKIDIDNQDQSGMTALHIAVLGNDMKDRDIIEDLLIAGANSNLANKEEKTPKNLAEEDENIIDDIKDLFESPPPVAGPLAPTRLDKGNLPEGDGLNACRKTRANVRDIYAADEQNTDSHLPLYTRILDLVYGEQSLDAMFQSLRGQNVPQRPMCRWIHIPMNNVRTDCVYIPSCGC
jgi:hypothetical protein